MITDQKIAESNLWVIRFDSLTDQIDTVFGLKEKFANDPYYGEKNLQYHTEFFGEGFNSWNEIKDKIHSRWDRGMRIYDNMMNQLRDAHIPAPKSLKRRATWSDEEGDEIDLDRVRSGQPYMRTTRRDHRPGPLSITLICENSAHGGIDSEDVLWRGAASVCLMELLESAGYRVEFWAAKYTTDAYRNRCGAVVFTNLKFGTDPIDASTLINATSGWCMRTLFLASYHVADDVPRTEGGMPTNISYKKHHITRDEQTIICRGIWSHSAAVNWVREEIKKLK